MKDVMHYSQRSNTGEGDGTTSPWAGQANYEGPGQMAFAGEGDLMVLGLPFEQMYGVHNIDHLGADTFGLDDFADLDDDMSALSADVVLGEDLDAILQGDLSILGISEPMVWGSDEPDAMGWDELGADDFFGWSPFKAVARAVSSVAKSAVRAVKNPVRTIKRAVRTTGRIVKKAGRVTQALLKSPITKAVVGGVAIAFPAVGVPLAAGLATAAALSAAVNSKIPSQALAAKKIVLNTFKGAKTPGPNQKAHQVALSAIAMAANQRRLENMRKRAAMAAKKKPAARIRVPVRRPQAVVRRKGSTFAPKRPAVQHRPMRTASTTYRAVAAAASARPTLTIGMSGPAVSTARAFFGLPASDKFDKAMDAAVRKYKIAHGLPHDGVVGGKVWDAILAPRAAPAVAAPTYAPPAIAAPSYRAQPAPPAIQSHAGQQATINLPPVAYGGRRINQKYGRKRVTHDISPSGYIATYVTDA